MCLWCIIWFEARKSPRHCLHLFSFQDVTRHPLNWDQRLAYSYNAFTPCLFWICIFHVYYALLCVLPYSVLKSILMCPPPLLFFAFLNFPSFAASVPLAFQQQGCLAWWEAAGLLRPPLPSAWMEGQSGGSVGELPALRNAVTLQHFWFGSF